MSSHDCLCISVSNYLKAINIFCNWHLSLSKERLRVKSQKFWCGRMFVFSLPGLEHKVH